MKKPMTAVVLAALLLLAACGSRSEALPTEAPAPAAEQAVPAAEPTATPEAIPTPTAAPAPTEPPAAPAATVKSGEYRYTDKNGTVWVLTLKDSGLFSVVGPGEGIYNGEGWSTGADGLVYTGATEGAGQADFFDEFGCSIWHITGKTSCEPVY